MRFEAAIVPLAGLRAPATTLTPKPGNSRADVAIGPIGSCRCAAHVFLPAGGARGFAVVRSGGTERRFVFSAASAAVRLL